MDTTIKTALIDAGIDVDTALERFMGNENLLKRMLKKFVADGTFDALSEAVANGDTAAALTASHTLKGVSGNLSLSTLYELTAKQVDLYRAGDSAAADAMLTDIATARSKALAAISALE